MEEKTPQALPESGFLRLSQVLKIFPVSKSTWWAGVRDGKYPRGVKLGARVTAWRVSDIRALIDGATPPAEVPQRPRDMRRVESLRRKIEELHARRVELVEELDRILEESGITQG